MKRRFLNVLTALSLLLCVAVSVLWVRSYWASDVLEWVYVSPAELRAVTVSTTSGGLTVSNRTGGPVVARPGQDRNGWSFWRYSESIFSTVGRPKPSWQWPGFDHEVNDLSIIGKRTEWWGVPLWLPWLLTAIPSSALMLRLRRPRHPVGHCARCGYDLRATPDHCPECGTRPRGAV